MRISTFAFVATFGLLGGPVLAADYEPPLTVADAPEYVPVEVGSGWYLRGDISYNISDPVYDFTLLGEDTDNIRFGASGGIGYHFNDVLRTELNVGFVGSDKYEYNDGIDSGSAAFKAWTGMLNGYIDLGTYAGITPYVGAGVGIMAAKHEFTIDSPTLGVAVDMNDRQYEFAYSLGAGLNYRLGQNASIDVGYEYLSAPGMQYLDTDTLTLDKGVNIHRVKVGLRYDLW